MSLDFRFGVESGGGLLSSTSPLYGSGEVRCQGSIDATPTETFYLNPCFGVVTEGVFEYETNRGRERVRPGTILIGGVQESFRFRFVVDAPISRSVLALRPDVVSSLAEDVGACPELFRERILQPTHRTLPLYGAIRRLAARSTPDEDAVLALAAAALRELTAQPAPKPTFAERRRVQDVAAYIDAGFADAITLDEMASMAGLSRYHFIRVFTSVTGERPHRYLIAARLRSAADKLLSTREPIISIALGCGFNDISNFTNTFRRAFGVPPRRWREVAC